MMPHMLALFGADLKPAVDAIDYGVSTTVPLVQQAVFWFLLCWGVGMILGVILLILQIRRHLRREPPISKEIDDKLKERDEVYDKRFNGLNLKIENVSGEIKTLSRDIRELGEKTANQQGTIDMINSRQVQMDGKLDRIAERI